MTVDPSKFERHANGFFKKGSGGRVAGSRNKLQHMFVEDLAKDWEVHGAGVIRIVRIEEPASYMRIVASVLPKEFIVSESELDKMSDDELVEALQIVKQAKAATDGTAAMTDDVTIKPEALEALERRLLDVHERRQIRKSMAAWAQLQGLRAGGASPADHERAGDGSSRATSTTCCCCMRRRAAQNRPTSARFSRPGTFANFPQNNILFATHSDDFAHRWGRRVRNDVTNESDVLGISMSPSSGAADQFALNEGGEYYAVGAGKGISGFRADLGLCDDLFGNREDAWSDTVRQKRWDWYVDDFGPRLKPRAKRIMMNTSWHELDVAGRVIAQIEAGHVRGKVIDIPAIAGEDDPVGRKPGEYLWDEPQGYDYGRFLRERQREASPMMWAALFQQKPAPEDGDYFKAEWIRPYDVAPDPETMRIYGASDFAVTADAGDWTVHSVIGVDPEGKPHLLDLWRKQASSNVWVEAFCDLVKKWKPMGWAFEKGQIASGVGPFLERRQRERQAYVAKSSFPTRGDKAVRAQSFRGYIASHGLHVALRAPWYATLRTEMLSFPAGRHDDIVDALGLVGQLLDRMLSGEKPQVPEPPGNMSGYAPFVAPSQLDDWKAW